ncbi:MAG: hypothetical protein K6D37_10960 [Prevotella sp.]|nr:hypothetical protein [Prevotella sp.]
MVELTFRPSHPGIVFEKIVVDFGGCQPSCLFMPELPCRRSMNPSNTKLNLTMI